MRSESLTFGTLVVSFGCIFIISYVYAFLCVCIYVLFSEIFKIFFAKLFHLKTINAISKKNALGIVKV